MRKYLNLIIIGGILLLGHTYIKDFVMDILEIIKSPKPMVIYASDVVSSNIDELKYEIDELNNLLQLNNNLSDYEMINATIITRDIDSWYETFTVDKGIKDGVKEGMGVMIDSGLVGTIYSVSNYTSNVRLLTGNRSNKLSVRINHEGEYIYCILDRYNDFYILTGISDITSISEGDIVTTSGLGDLPSGLVIGYVSKIETDSYEVDKIVYVNPIEGMDSIRYVGIISKDF